MFVLQLIQWFIAQKRKRKKLTKIAINLICGRCESVTMASKQMFTTFVKECGYIPTVLTNGAVIIEKNLKTKELFQIQGSAAKISYVLNQLGVSRSGRIKNATVHDVIEAMKTFLIRLAEPLLPEEVCDVLIKASPDEDCTKYTSILTSLRQINPQNFGILHFMMLLLRKVANFAEHNTMNVRKLATIFVLDVINPLKIDDPTHTGHLEERMQRLPYLIMVVENMINNVHMFNGVSQMKVSMSPIRGSSVTRVLATPPLRTRSFIGTESGVGISSFPYSTRNESMANTCETHLVAQINSETLTTGSETKQKKPIQGHSSSDISVPQKTNPHNELLDFMEEQNFQSLLCNNKLKMLTPRSADHFNTKSWKSKTPSVRSLSKNHKQNSSPSPKFRKSSKGRSDYNNTDLKPPKSFEKKLDGKGKHAHGGQETKKKRKSRSVHRFSKLAHASRRKSRSKSKDSNYTIFQADEELCPWNDFQSISDDTSIMAKTIRSPRVLSVAATDLVSKHFLEKNHDKIWQCQYNEVIDSPNIRRTKVMEYKHILPSLESFLSPNKFDSNKSISISQSLKVIQETSEKHTIEYSVVQSDKRKRPEFRPLSVKKKKTLDIYHVSQKRSEIETSQTSRVNSQSPSQGIKNKAPSTPVNKSVTVSNTILPLGVNRITPVGKEEKSHTSFSKARPAAANMSDFKRRYSFLQNNFPGGDPEQRNQTINYGERLVDFVLVCITLLCTCLVFYIHQYNNLFHQ